MNAGEIGTEAGRIFEYNLPSCWIFRSQEDQNDFGIDGEIELKNENGKARIQLRSATPAKSGNLS